MSLCLFFFGSPKCNAHALRFAMRRRGCLSPLCTFPGGHWIRATIKCGHRKMSCLFKQEPLEGARWLLWKRGRNPTTRGLAIFTDIDVVQSSLSKIYFPIILRPEFRYLFRRWLSLFVFDVLDSQNIGRIIGRMS